MLRCISKDYPHGLPFASVSSSLYPRKRLIANLLSCRSALRVICAPSLYGKSALAYQYASCTFAPENVQWVDAEDPLFLLALDAPMSAEFQLCFLDRETDRYRSMLFVFDGCPAFEDERFESLRKLVEDLLRAGHEVLLTTADTRWLALDAPACERVDARMLLLNDDEHASWPFDDFSEEELEGDAGDERGGLLDRIVGCRMGGSDRRERFMKSLMDMDIRCEEDALSLVLMLLSEGALHELHAFTNAVSDTLIDDLERRYPHVGIVSLSPMFRAVFLTEGEKFSLVSRHLSALVQALPLFDTAEALVEALIGQFVTRGNLALATQLACGMHDDRKRAAFFAEHAALFLFTGKPLMLVYVARTLPRSFFGARRSWASVALVLAMLGETELSSRVMRSFRYRAGHGPASDGAGLREASEEEPLSDALIEAFVKVMFDMAEEGDLDVLRSLVSAGLARIEESGGGEDAAKTKRRPEFVHDLFMLFDQVMEDPCAGMACLQRIAAAGHSLKESLRATCYFVGLLTFLWKGRSKADFPLRSQGGFDLAKRAPEETEMLSALERHIVHILSRQAALFEPNVYALYLFEKMSVLFGERAYLQVSDATLSHIEAARSGLALQRARWAADHNAPLLAERTQEEKGRTRDAKGAKRLRINTLGRFEIETYDPKITIKNKVRKQLRLLISLIAMNAGREVSRPWVQRIMWPDAPERNARQNLYTMWSLLNRSVIDEKGECPFFESYPRSIALNTHLVETDTQLLSDLCKHLREGSLTVPEYKDAIERIEGIYRGPLLPGEDTAEVVANRKKYQDRLLEALLMSGERLRRRGETTLALRYFRFAFDNEPTREDVCYQLMLALWKLGRHGEALNEYFVCRRALIDTFGIEGTSKLRELYEAILNDAS